MLTILKNRELRTKILFSLLAIVVFRLLTHIPAPGVDLTAVRTFLSSNALFGLFNLFSGGGFQNFSIVTLGLGPYINSSIIIQLFSKMIPALEELTKEGEAGREKINMYTKLLTVPLSLLQAYGVYFLLSRQTVIPHLDVIALSVLLLTLVSGSMIMIWVGDLVTEYGIGQGISVLIFVGIVSGLPSSVLNITNLISSVGIATLLILGALLVLVILSVVYVNEGTRNIPLEYGRRDTRTQKITNYLPIKINQAGVIPIIFAVSLVLVPSIISGPLLASSNAFLQKVGLFLAQNFAQTAFLYNLGYFALVFGFTYFYTFMQFNPEKIAEDVKKRGGFIPGIRPGLSTERYLKDVVTKLTLAGALFLGLIAILPYVIQGSTGFANLAIGGTGLLIVVSVVLETIRQAESMLVTRNYQSFLR